MEIQFLSNWSLLYFTLETVITSIGHVQDQWNWSTGCRCAALLRVRAFKKSYRCSPKVNWENLIFTILFHLKWHDVRDWKSTYPFLLEIILHSCHIPSENQLNEYSFKHCRILLLLVYYINSSTTYSGMFHSIHSVIRTL